MSDTRQPGGGGGRGLPPWLSDVPLPPRPAAPAPTPAENSSLPDWLRELQSSVPGDASPPAEPAQGDADWLSDRSATPAPEASADAEQTMPDWLRELSAAIPEAEPAVPSQPPAPRPSPRVEGATSWLASLAQPTEEAPPAPPEPPAAKSPSRPLKRMPSGATDWLRSLGQEPDADAPPPPSAKAPQEPPPPASSPTPPSDDGIPSWLSDISEEELARDLADATESAAAPDAPGSAPDDKEDLGMPSWLAASAAPSEAPPDADAPAMPLWLRDQGDEGAAVPPSSDRDEDDGDVSVPDWLRLAREDDATEQPPASEHDASIPAWLRGTPTAPDTEAPSAAPREQAPSESPAPDEPTTPAWLRDADTAADDEKPAWLRDLDTDEPSETPESASTSATPSFQPDAAGEIFPSAREGDNLPSWLRAEEPAARPAPADEQQVPDWLRADDQPEADSSEPMPAWMQTPEAEDTSGAPPASDADDVPPWLRETEGEPPLVAPPVPGDANLPAWLRGADDRPSSPAAPEPQPIAPAEPATSGEPAAPEDAETLPPWLQDVEDTGASAVPTAPEPRSVSGDFLGGSDLPGWLRPKEAEAAPPPVDVSPRSADWLERLRAQEAEAEADALEGEAALAAIAVARPTFSRTPAQLEAIGLLQRLTATPFPGPAPRIEAEAQPAWRRVRAEQLLYLLLLIALLAGLLVPTLSAPFAGPSSTPEAAAIAAANDQLNDRSRVLVAYEWDTRRRSELAPLEQTVMDHLAQRGVKFVFVSTDVQGTLLSFDARDRLVDPANGYGYLPGGRDYILLGYRPGGELALRALAQDLPGVLRSDFQGQDATQSSVASDVQTGQPLLTSLNDFAQIVVMADDPQDVQGWMEQVHSQAPNVPVVLLLPEETTPIVQPYLRQPNIFYLAGKSDALAYAQLRGGEQGAAASATSGQLSYAVAAFVALALVGALVGALAGRRGAA